MSAHYWSIDPKQYLAYRIDVMVIERETGKRITLRLGDLPDVIRAVEVYETEPIAPRLEPSRPARRIVMRDQE